MRLVWCQRPQLERKMELAEAFGAGLPRDVDYRISHEFERVEETDWLVLFGIGGVALRIHEAYRAAGIPVIYIDKGYFRNQGMWRVSVREHQPLAYFQCNRPHDRADIRLAPYHKGTHILFDGASNKFCLWKGLGDWQDWGESVVRKIRQHSDWPIIYRPRPRHHHETKRPVGIEGTELSIGSLEDDLARARLCVSYGGNIGVDSVISGVPHFALADSPARPLSETRWEHLERLRIPTDAERRQWLADLSYCNFSTEEFASGFAWSHIEAEVMRAA